MDKDHGLKTYLKKTYQGNNYLFTVIRFLVLPNESVSFIFKHNKKRVELPLFLHNRKIGLP
ncbi:hypothetical protein SAMN05660649_05109 [Desulfotomaculum arcticum]|uniref:Uncharacterized protein n=1 Tax=Desulfotruncus arcticus DSM 17038 TaxID=1121424 RepID=A0A1I2ZTB5_9FIRM|nr:hypothetical protein SAMN05660649_05109 [Desulfotomaculum arcticum] [Desulfotruncus arcticus DSM 17038]